jgi:hypothetical protein
MCCHRQHKRYKEVYIEFPNLNLEMEFSILTRKYGDEAQEGNSPSKETR